MRGRCGTARARRGFSACFGEAMGLCWAGLGSLGWLRKVACWAGLARWAGLGWSRQQGWLQMRGSGQSTSQSKSVKAENELETATSGMDCFAQNCGAKETALRTLGHATLSRSRLKHQPSSTASDAAVTLSSALPLPWLFPLPLPLSGLPSSAAGQCSLRWPGNPQ